MKKNSTDKLLTLNFGRMCIANFLLYTSVYLILPLIPAYSAQHMGLSFQDLSFLFLILAGAMLAVGPFHAYLGDAYKRKSVMSFGILMWAVSSLGMLFVNQFYYMAGLVFLQGAGWGMAVTAGLTVAIDITASPCRSAGNELYALMGRLGAFSGVASGLYLSAVYEFRLLVYLAVAMSLLAIFLVTRVYVAFRAPIGVPVCTFDRFLLPRAWFPALNVLALSVIPGLLLASPQAGSASSVLSAFALMAVVAVPLTQLFVKFSYHCQRGTANTTCQLSFDCGILLGMYVAFHVDRVGDAAISLGIISLLCFCLLTLPYYRKMRLR